MTTIAVNVGSKQLLQLGLSISDVTTLVSLGRSVGNWMTAQSGDDELFKAIDSDENTLTLRRGLLDLDDFNKRWRKDCKILANGRPKKVDERVIGTFSRFTAIMVSVVTCLDAFCSSRGVVEIVEVLLKEMLRAPELGEDLVKAELYNRVQAWRSAGVMRNMALNVQKQKQALLKSRVIQTGYAPITETPLFQNLLIWLLLGTEDTFVTPSSDVAAMALCLSNISIDLMDVRGLTQREALDHSACKVIYDPSTSLASNIPNYSADAGFTEVGQKRALCSPVPLIDSEEAVSIFPLPSEAREKCRYAWIKGKAAAKEIRIQLVTPSNDEVSNSADVCYVLSTFDAPVGLKPSQQKSKRGHERTDFSDIIQKNIFVNSKHLKARLNDALEEYKSISTWLALQGSDGEVGEGENGWVSSPDFCYDYRIEAFSVLQSFLLGYYYHLFLRFVDTTTLELQIVEGDWGFRSTDLITRMRQYCFKSKQYQPSKVMLKRQDVIEILSSLLLARRLELENRTRFNHCIGVIDKRTLLTASLVRSTDCPDAIGHFVLLDVDTGGIPRDSEGIVRPGNGESSLHPKMRGVPLPFVNGYDPSVKEDLTRHIEADWAGNREKLLLVFRSNGRRLFSLNTAETDLRICCSHVCATGEEGSRNGLQNALKTGLDDLLEGYLQTGAFMDGDHPVLFQAYNRPNLRYAAVGVNQSNELRLASDNTEAALKSADRSLPPVIVAAEGEIGRKLRFAAAKNFSERLDDSSRG